MALPGRAYHADSDADDEFERSEITSPALPTDDDDSTSVSNSDPPSTEPTPTYGRPEGEKMSPTDSIAEWSIGQCADFIASLDMPQYCDKFIENEITGEALAELGQEELKEMNILSMGHRLAILKAIYDVKIKQGFPIEPDSYVPPSYIKHEEKAPGQDVFDRLVRSMLERDERLIKAESALQRIAEDYRRLRDELLPVFRMAKNSSQPLPYHPNSHSPDLQNQEDTLAPMSQQPEKASGLARKWSTKKLWLGNTPKSSSPTHLQQSIPEGKSMADNSSLDPSAAALAASSHLTASINGGQPSTSPNQANIPSPTSPSITYANEPTLSARAWNGREREVQTPSTARSMYTHQDGPFPHGGYNSTSTTLVSDRNISNPTPTPGGLSNSSRSRQQQQPPLRDPQVEDPPQPSSSSTISRNNETPSVEIFKSFRVSMEDPCHKVLPAALKKYNINADWRQYALYIVFGDQERCLGMEEKPLILFKQLDKEGRKPMFMLRRHAQPQEGHSGPVGGGGSVGSMGWDSGPSAGLGSLGRAGGGSSIQLPGGVL
ncbi:MAG: hypothetical protein LQ351_007646 [Letrouitia transgressa]|nr:MAG: hypothetical protein LQ351_007646 [Letrouitia transgressa]